VLFRESNGLKLHFSQELVVRPLFQIAGACDLSLSPIDRCCTDVSYILLAREDIWLLPFAGVLMHLAADAFRSGRDLTEKFIFAMLRL
jgi:hypothetical protein